MVRTKAGKLRHSVTIQTVTRTNDAAGQPVETWATLYAGVPMCIAEQVGSESRDGKQVMATGTLTMQMRWLSGVTPDQRLTWDGRTFGIMSVDDPDGTRNHVLLTVREVR